jgi:nitroimidazol reductase NimA-like FMN-containing flavoprotein (pyridoxamine 5'-phosphate oxidase superfamily)
MSDLQTLNPDECWEHLRRHRIGRIGFNRGRGDRIHPVDYTVDGEELVLGTSPDSELGMFFLLFSAGALVPFEVDELAEDAAERWSVLVRGQLRATETPPPTAVVTPEGHDELWLRLVPVQVTGRRLLEP